MAAADDLTGRWIGRYIYASRNDDPVPFEAELWQTGTTLEGRLIEPNTFQPDAGPELSAQLFGWVAQGEIGFTKRYSGLDQEDHPKYGGRILRAGLRIEGNWHFPSQTWWRGGFTMNRVPRAMAKAQRTTEADL